MKRMTPFSWRAGLGVGAFILTLAGLGFMHFFAFSSLQRQRWDNLAMFVLLFLWSVIAYFPARWIYLATTFKHFSDGIHCEGCAYDLTANRSGRCPECGRAVGPMSSKTSREPANSMARADREIDSGSNYRRFAIWLACTVLAATCVSVFIWKSTQRQTIPEGFELVRGDWCFVRWSRDSLMQDVDPNSVFAIVNGVQRARFTFLSGERDIIESAGLADALGRPWLDLEFLNGRSRMNHYLAEQRAVNADPDVTYTDLDGDFSADQRKDWVSGDVSCIDRVPKWHPCPAPNNNGEDAE